MPVVNFPCIETATQRRMTLADNENKQIPRESLMPVCQVNVSNFEVIRDTLSLKLVALGPESSTGIHLDRYIL